LKIIQVFYPDNKVTMRSFAEAGTQGKMFEGAMINLFGTYQNQDINTVFRVHQ
jgi:hypothetical protein